MSEFDSLKKRLEELKKSYDTIRTEAEPLINDLLYFNERISKCEELLKTRTDKATQLKAAKEKYEKEKREKVLNNPSVTKVSNIIKKELEELEEVLNRLQNIKNTLEGQLLVEESLHLIKILTTKKKLMN